MEEKRKNVSFYTVYVCVKAKLTFASFFLLFLCSFPLQSLIFNSDIMQLLANLFLLSHQLSLTSGLRVIDNGLGLPVYASEEEEVVDYALLADDHKAALPSQVQSI